MTKVKFFQFDENDIILMADALENYRQKLKAEKEQKAFTNDATLIQARICDITRMMAFLLED